MNSLRKAVGAFSMSCSTVSLHVSLPSRSHPDMSFWNSGNRLQWFETMKPSSRMLLPTANMILRGPAGIPATLYCEIIAQSAIGQTGSPRLARPPSARPRHCRSTHRAHLGRPQRGLGQIAGRFIVYDVVDADLLEKRAFVGAARRSYDRVPLDLGDLTDNRADRAGRTQMELSCPHYRPRRRHRGPAGGGSKRGRREKSWPAAARKRKSGYFVCVDALSAAILHWPASAVSWREELSPG